MVTSSRFVYLLRRPFSRRLLQKHQRLRTQPRLRCRLDSKSTTYLVLGWWKKANDQRRVNKGDTESSLPRRTRGKQAGRRRRQTTQIRTRLRLCASTLFCGLPSVLAYRPLYTSWLDHRVPDSTHFDFCFRSTSKSYISVVHDKNSRVVVQLLEYCLCTSLKPFATTLL